MSADEVLASNLWLWPDPLLKRNQHGQVMFVNAAFLQLYGGRVEDWSGKPLAGWPAPVQAGAQRFETRAGVAPQENVFDWVESVMADGNALAIARNVTVFMAPPSPPAEEFTPATPDVPEVSTHQAPPVQVEAQMPPPAHIPVEAPIPAPHIQAEQTQQLELNAPSLEPVMPELNVQELNVQESNVQLAAPELTSEFEATLDKRADEYAYADNQAAQPAQSARVNQPSAAIAAPVADQMLHEMPQPSQVQAAPAAAPIAQPVAHVQAAVPMVQAPVAQPQPAIQPEAQTEDRMIERRALPIKDSASVLGSNWRDQVIAKAVGDEAAAPASANTVIEEEPEEPPKLGAGLKILLAEDNAINALLTRTLLEADGAEVDTVEDGALALKAVGEKKYDLIFMDMRMPNMDGLESTRKIRAFGSTMPIIALTANAFDDDRNACFDSGMNDFMTKPVSAEELSEMVVNWTKTEEEKRMAG